MAARSFVERQRIVKCLHVYVHMEVAAARCLCFLRDSSSIPDLHALPLNWSDTRAVAVNVPYFKPQKETGCWKQFSIALKRAVRSGPDEISVS